MPGQTSLAYRSPSASHPCAQMSDRKQLPRRHSAPISRSPSLAGLPSGRGSGVSQPSFPNSNVQGLWERIQTLPVPLGPVHRASQVRGVSDLVLEPRRRQLHPTPLLANSRCAGPIRCAGRVLARSGFGKQYVRGTLIEQKVVAGGLLGVSLLLPP